MTSTTLSPPTLSPPELAYLYTSLSLSYSSTESRKQQLQQQQQQHPPISTFSGPIRPDARTPLQFRPLIAETDILPSCFGSARVVIGGGETGECIVGVKAEVEKTIGYFGGGNASWDGREEGAGEGEGEEAGGQREENWKSWVEINVETQGLRDDDALNIVIAGVIAEGVLGAESSSNCDEGPTEEEGSMYKSLRINDRFHWKLYVDVKSSSFSPFLPTYLFSNLQQRINKLTPKIKTKMTNRSSS